MTNLKKKDIIEEVGERWIGEQGASASDLIEELMEFLVNSKNAGATHICFDVSGEDVEFASIDLIPLNIIEETDEQYRKRIEAEDVAQRLRNVELAKKIEADEKEWYYKLKAKYEK